jgi:hypothetical protein
MPPLARRDVRNLVRKLGVHARPAEQQRARNQNYGHVSRETLLALVAAGVMPVVVEQLGPGSAPSARADAACVLAGLALWAEMKAVTIDASGAMELQLLVELLGAADSTSVTAAASTVYPRSQS